MILERVGVEFDGHAALRDVSLSVRPGEVVAIVGPSGAGKTTLLRLCNATVHPARGRVVLGGKALTELHGRDLRRARTTVGFVHQDHALVPNLRVVQNVLAGRLGRFGFLSAMRAMFWPPARDLVGVHALLGRVGIAEKLYQRTDRLSGGQQQRVAIARALWQEPRILLADEPVASVDPARARDVIRLFLEVATERRLTLVVSLHDLQLAREFFPRLVGLRGGRIAIDGPTDDVPAEAFAALYALEGTQASPGVKPGGGAI